MPLFHVEKFCKPSDVGLRFFTKPAMKFVCFYFKTSWEMNKVDANHSDYPKSFYVLYVVIIVYMFEYIIR